MQTQPIGVACPRCSDDIMCTVEVKLLTGHRADMRLVDLADRFAEHYVAAGHVASKGVARRGLFAITAEALRDSSPVGRVLDGIAGARPKAPSA